MSEIILHHYAGSPFSEKVRLILGFKKMEWRSVLVPSIMPKPDVMSLTGGYRRTPFMQIGADIYCDTALMCRVIDAIRPEPSLYPTATAGIAELIAQWADTTLFWTAVPFTMQPSGVVHVLKGATPDMLKAFGADRSAMNPNLRRPTIADGGAALKTYLTRLEHLLSDGRPFLLGALPCIADFSAAQSVWFMHLAPPIATMLSAFPKVEHWYTQVSAFGHGNMSKMTSEEAIAVAKADAHVSVSFIPETGLDAGDEVSITPTDYAHDPVVGKLIGLGQHESVIERTDPRAGTVHVHFPRIAFQIKKTVAA